MARRFLAALLALALLCASAAAAPAKPQGRGAAPGKAGTPPGKAGTPPGKGFALLVIRDDCVAPFFQTLDWLRPSELTNLKSPLWDCVKASVSKGLGFGIIAGSAFVKVPQVWNIIAAGGAEGLSAASQYQEFASNVLATLWNAWHGSPVSAYGESVIVSLGSAAVIVTMWSYSRPGGAEVALCVAFFVALAALATSSPDAVAALAVSAHLPLATPAAVMDALQFAGSAAFWGSRVTQIVASAQARSMGTVSVITLAMNFLGTSARVFTGAQEVKDPLAVAITAFNALLNAVLLVQWAMYREGGGGKGAKAPKGGRRAAKPRAATPVAAKATPPVAAPAAAPAAAPVPKSSAKAAATKAASASSPVVPPARAASVEKRPPARGGRKAAAPAPPPRAPTPPARAASPVAKRRASSRARARAARG